MRCQAYESCKGGDYIGKFGIEKSFEAFLNALSEIGFNGALAIEREAVTPDVLLHNYRHPSRPLRGAMAPTDRFRAAVQEAKIGPSKDIPHVRREVIVKYVTDLQLLGML